MIIKLKHARVSLALHRLQEAAGTPLLLLHALGGSAADWDLDALGWNGPAYALDLCGHGRSGHVRGGGYHAELWAADADLALAELGDDALLAGAGVSAYVALLLASARPDAVRGALLLPGTGLEGGGPEPDFAQIPVPLPASGASGALHEAPALDPAVRFSESIVRPPDLARTFAGDAGPLVLCEDGRPRPAWWRALHGLPHVQLHHGGAASGLSLLAASTRSSGRRAARSA